MHKHNVTIKSQWRRATQFYRKYPSHFIERVVCERGLETEQSRYILTPTLLALTAFLSHSPGLLDRGPRSPASLGVGFLYHILSPLVWSPSLNRGAEGSPCWVLASLPHLVTNWLNFLCTVLYNSSTSTFLWASQIALIQLIHGQGYTLQFLDRMHLLFT